MKEDTKSKRKRYPVASDGLGPEVEEWPHASPNGKGCNEPSRAMAEIPYWHIFHFHLSKSNQDSRISDIRSSALPFLQLRILLHLDRLYRPGVYTVPRSLFTLEVVLTGCNDRSTSRSCAVPTYTGSGHTCGDSHQGCPGVGSSHNYSRTGSFHCALGWTYPRVVVPGTPPTQHRGARKKGGLVTRFSLVRRAP